MSDNNIKLLLQLLFCLTGSAIVTGETPQNTTQPAGKLLYEGPIPDGPAMLVGEIGVVGKKYPLMIDTGCEASLMPDTPMAKQFGKPLGEVGVRRSDVKGQNYSIPEATVGGLVLPAGVAPAYDFQVIRTHVGIDVFGVMGWKALRGNTLQLDHDAGMFRILQGTVKLPGAGAELPVAIENYIPSIHASLGDRDLSWAIDTGYNGAILLSSWDFERMVTDGFIRRKSGGSITGVGGKEQIQNGYFIKGTLLNIDLTGLNVATNSRDINILGMIFLRKLNFALSIDPSRFSYSIRKSPVHPISEQLMMGVIFGYNQGEVVVARVKPGSNAEKAGLVVGDRVNRIDELGDGPMDGFKMYDLCRKHAGQPVTLQLSRGGRLLTIQLPLTATVDAWDEAPVKSK